jgi:hypothetical protein
MTDFDKVTCFSKSDNPFAINIINIINTINLTLFAWFGRYHRVPQFWGKPVCLLSHDHKGCPGLIAVRMFPDDNGHKGSQRRDVDKGIQTHELPCQYELSATPESVSI